MKAEVSKPPGENDDIAMYKPRHDGTSGNLEARTIPVPHQELTANIF